MRRTVTAIAPPGELRVALHFWRAAFGQGVGTRTPTGDPAWATPRVVRGGFTTGLAAELPRDTGAAGAEGGNGPWLTEDGLRRLTACLADGRYAVELPEHAALLSAAYLNAHGDQKRTVEVAEAICEYLPRLQFFPTPLPAPVSLKTVVVQDAAQCLANLRKAADRRPRRALAVHRWYTRAGAGLVADGVALVLQTFADPAAVLAAAASSPGTRGVGGATPRCRWAEEVAGWLARFRESRTRDGLDPEELSRTQQRGTVGVLRATFAAVVESGPAAVTLRQRGLLRSQTVLYVAKHGAPGSAESRARLALLAGQVPRLVASLAAVLAARLERRIEAAGGPVAALRAELDAVLEPAAADEDAEWAGAPVPAPLAAKAWRCWHGSLEELLGRGLVKSAEGLAVVGVQHGLATAGHVSVADRALRRLLLLTERGFRLHRRSVLLVDHASQVRVGELPWYSALLSHAAERGAQGRSVAAAQEQAEVAAAEEALDQLVAGWWTHFPFTAAPNKLVNSLKYLAEPVRAAMESRGKHTDADSAAGVPTLRSVAGDYLGSMPEGAREQLPFTSELAKDIFMGNFGAGFARALLVAEHEMKGSLYEEYFMLEDAFAAALARDPGEPPATDAEAAAGVGAEGLPAVGPIAQQLADLYADRAASIAAATGRVPGPSERDDKLRFVVRNGRAIEAQMIATTHNLAPLAPLLLDRVRAVDPEAAALCCWRHVMSCLRRQPLLCDAASRRARLKLTKTIAYTMRQCVFFLSLVERRAAAGGALQSGRPAALAVVEKMRKELLSASPEATFAEAIDKQYLGRLSALCAGSDATSEMPVLAWFGQKLPPFFLFQKIA